jgi:hypothetical protein
MSEISSEQKMSNLLKLIGGPGQCKSCQAPLWWITTKAGKAMPLNSDGVVHWATCPQSREWKKEKQIARTGA